MMSLVIVSVAFVWAIVAFLKGPKKFLKKEYETEGVAGLVAAIGLVGMFFSLILTGIGLGIQLTYLTEMWVVWVPVGIMCAFFVAFAVGLISAGMRGEDGSL